MLFKPIKSTSSKRNQNRTQPLASLLLARMVKLKQPSPNAILFSSKKKFQVLNLFNKSLTQLPKAKLISDNLKDRVSELTKFTKLSKAF